MLIKGDKKEQLGVVQSNLEADIHIDGAESIVSVMAEAVVVAVEAMQNEAKVDYRVTYKVIYSTQDGIECATEESSSSLTIKSKLIAPKSVINVKLQVFDLEHIGTTKVRIRGILEANSYAINNVEIEALDKEDDICAKTEIITMQRIQALSEQEIMAQDTLEFKEGVDSIIAYETSIAVSNATCGAEICSVEGTSCTYLMYLSKGNLYSRAISMPFSGECLASNIEEGMQAYLDGVAESTTITLVDGAGSTGVKLEVVITIGGYCIATEEATIMVDAYSQTKELGIEFAECKLQENICYTGGREKLSGSVRLAEDSKRIRSVLAVSKPTISGVTVTNNGVLQCDGVANVPVIYLDEDENYAEVMATVQFSCSVTRDFDCSNSLNAVVKVCDIQARMRHNDEIDIMGELRIEVYGSNDTYIKYIKSITELGDIPENDVAISLYIVREGETLFDVAKAMLSDEDTLLQLNPEVTLPLTAGEKILLYRQLD